MSFLATQLIGFGASSGVVAASGETWDSATKSSRFTLSNSDMTATSDASFTNCSLRSVNGKSTGKWYAEMVVNFTSASNNYVGVCTSSFNNTSRSDGDSNVVAMNMNGGVYAFGSPSGNSGLTASSGSILQIAFDRGTGDIWFGVNNTYAGSPSSGSSPSVGGITGTRYLHFSCTPNTSVAVLNSTLTYSPPTGFTQWGP